MKKIFFGLCVMLTSFIIAPEAEARTWNRAKQLSYNQNVVIVDVSMQSVNVLRNGNSIYNTGTVTGKSGTPSDYGEFKIYAKQRNRYLTGADYRAWVNFWMPYNRGEGLHDASWRSADEYGVPGHNIENGSHGCINLSYGAANKIWNLTRVGTPVIVVP